MARTTAWYTYPKLIHLQYNLYIQGSASITEEGTESVWEEEDQVVDRQMM